MSSTDILTLNVGGKTMLTSRMTLISESQSVLAKMFDPDSTLPPAKLVDGAFFIDANPDVFSVILDYLRYKTLIIPPKMPEMTVLAQARYFGLDEIVNKIQFGEESEQTRDRIHVNAGGQMFETSIETLVKQPNSRLAEMTRNLTESGGNRLFLDVCPKSFEILLNFLRSGVRKVPWGLAVTPESVGYTAQTLGLEICLPSNKSGFCKVTWVDERGKGSANQRYLTCRALGLKHHKNSPDADLPNSNYFID